MEQSAQDQEKPAERAETAQTQTAQTQAETAPETSGTAGEPPAGAWESELESLKKRYAELKARYDAELANRANAAASPGSVSGGQAVERDYYGPQEWDRLPESLRQKFIRSGKIFEFMKKWSEKS